MSDVPNDPPPDDEPEPLPPAAKDAPLFAYEPKRCVRCDRRMRTDKAKAVYDLCNPCRRDDFKRAKAERLLPVKSKRTVDEVAELKKQMRIDRGFADAKTLANVVVEGREKLRPSPKELRKQSEIRYQKYIDLLREGHTVMEALAELKIQPPTMYQWRKRWPNLKAEEDAVRVNAGSMRKAQRQRVTKANSQFEDFRKKCFRYDTFWHHRKIIDVIEEGESLANENISMVLVPPEHGKGLSVDTLIPTPDGWTRMGHLSAGDTIYAANGDTTRVTWVSDVHHINCYRVEFSDGTELIADEEHRWQARSRGRKYREEVVTTLDLFEHPTCGKGRPNWSVPVAAAPDGPEANLPIDPWLLGVWLGDGSTGSGDVTSMDEEIWSGIRDLGYELRRPRTRSLATTHVVDRPVGDSLNVELGRLGVRGNKHIPMAYLRAGYKQRLRLLQGLIDTDGHVTPKGVVELCFTHDRLPYDALELIRSLGLKAKIHGRMTMSGKVAQRITFSPPAGFPISNIPRKQERLKVAPQGDRQQWKVVAKVSRVESVPTKCIAVDHPSECFLAGDGWNVTHNSTLVQDYICYRLGKDPNLRILLVGRKGQVDKIMNTVKRRMTDLGQYATYIETYGPFYTKGQEKLGRPWTQDYIQLALSNNDERDYNLETVSIGTEVQGTRTDLLIVDDIQSLKTLNLSDKYVDMFRQDFLSRVVKTGSTVILGTRVGEDDFYQKLLDLEIVNKLVLLPALVDGEPLWPEQWSPERLEKKRKIVGESAWWRNFMQAPRSEGTNPFTEDMVNQAWDTRIFAEPQDGEAMILGVDPALGGGNAVIAASWKQDRLSIIDCQVDYGLGRTEQILGVIDGFAARYRPQFVVMETTAMQKGFARDDRLAEIAAHWGFTMREHDTAGIKADPVLGVGAMASSFSRGEIRLAAGDDLTRRRLEPLVTELLSWRPDRSGRDLKQDTVMAMWFVWRWWAQARTYAATTGNDFKGRGLPWKSIAWNGPTRYQGVKRDMQRA